MLNVLAYKLDPTCRIRKDDPICYNFYEAQLVNAVVKISINRNLHKLITSMVLQVNDELTVFQGWNLKVHIINNILH